MKKSIAAAVFAAVLVACALVTGCSPAKITAAEACIAAVAPTVIADAQGTGTAAQKGTASGLAVVTNQQCVTAAAVLLAKAVPAVPTPAVVVPAVPVVPATP